MPGTPHEQLADAMIADCDGDPRAAVVALLKINLALRAHERARTGAH